jgi:uncharacterized damage-inducible protein DinB
VARDFRLWIEMNEIERIADQLSRIFDGDPWYGSNTMDVLRGMTARQAATRPIADAHTAWEIVLHMTTWNREVLRRLRTGVAREPQDADWPEAPEPTEESWRSSVAALAQSYRELIDAVRAFPPDRLDTTLGDERDRPLGSGVSYYVLLHGCVQHCVAHTAQISLLAKSFR